MLKNKVLPFKAGVHFNNFSKDRRKSWDTKIFSKGRKNFRRAGKNWFYQERTDELKTCAKNFSMKLILCELLRLNFKHKNNIKRKRLWVWQIFMDRYSKGKFHVLVKELKLFDHELFFRHIATRYFDFSQRCFSLCFVS